MIVVDASVLIDALLGNARIKEKVSSETLAAPYLVDVEVIDVIRRKTIGGGLDVSTANEALQDYRDLEISYYPHKPLLARTWELRANLTAYDALYVALAEVLEVSLLTMDRKIAAAPGVTATIELIPT